MPIYMQGDIFAEAIDNHYDMAIVFGYLGLNEMAMAWRNAQCRVPEWGAITDPFENQYNPPIAIEGETQLWRFIAAEENHGMTEERLRERLEALFNMAREEGLKTVITNGISDTNHGMSTNENRMSDDSRVRVMNDIMTAYEREGFSVTLISLNDTYTRNFPQQEN